MLKNVGSTLSLVNARAFKKVWRKGAWGQGGGFLSGRSFMFDRDFNVLSTGMIETPRENAQFVVACDHGGGHSFPANAWGWIVRFLLDHPLDVDGNPYAAGLPDTFPDYCKIVD